MSLSDSGVSAVAGAATQAVIVCSADVDPCRVVGGLTLLERLLRQLSELGTIQEILVVVSGEAALPAPSKRVGTPVSVIRAGPGMGRWQLVRHVLPRLRGRVLVIEGCLLVDPRLILFLASQTSDVVVKPRPESAAELLGSLSAESVASEGEGAPAVVVSEFPTHWEAQRGDVPVHLLRVVTPEDEVVGWRTLLDHVQKRALDLPALVFDPLLENPLLRILSRTSITPNQVTVATGIFGFLVTALLANGWLLAGLLLAVFVEVLDGVDGKLARLKRMTSKVGELEHVLDFFYENSWYLALGWYFDGKGLPWAWRAGVAMVVFDILGQLANLWFVRTRGRLLVHTSALLRAFRLVGGRRNIYVWMLLAGVLFGDAPAAFAGTAVWAGITAAVDLGFAFVQSWRIEVGALPRARP